MAALGSILNFATRVDTKFGNLDAELANKLGPPLAGGTFDPTLIDLSLGHVEYQGYTQAGAIAFALDPAKTPIIGGAVSVNVTGGGAAVTFPGTFFGLDGLISGAVLEAGVEYAFLFRHAEDWLEVAPGVFEDRVLVGIVGLGIPARGTFTPAAIVLGGAYNDYTQTGAIELAVSGSGYPGGASATVWITGDGSDITVNGTNVFWADGETGAKTWTDKRPVAIWRHPAAGAAFAFVPGDAVAAAVWGAITGTLGDQTDLQAALNAKAPTANPTFTGTVTIPDGALAIADTSGLQTALDLKAPAANPVFTGSVTIPDGALAIADTSGLQAALDAKLALAGGTMTGLLKVGTLRGTARDIGDAATIGANDNGKILFTTATGTATVSAHSVLAPNAGDTFVATVINLAAGAYTLDGPGATNIDLAQHDAATIVCQNGSAIRVYKAAGTVIS